MTEQQKVQLLPKLFENIDEGQRITVLHIGAALPATVDFFAQFRCKLYFLDLFEELPIVLEDENGPSVADQVSELVQFSDDTRFDICLFWDVFNYLNPEAIRALTAALAPYLSKGSLAHAFAVHNARSAPQHLKFEITNAHTLKVGARTKPVVNYGPHTQSKLKDLLSTFDFERTVLLADGRLEVLLRPKIL